MGNLLLLNGSHHAVAAATATRGASAITIATASGGGSAAQRRPCNNDEGGSEGMDSDGDGRDGDSEGSANEAEGRGKSGAAKEADSGAGGAEAGVELVLELGEAAEHVVEIVGVGVVRGREGVVMAVEFEKDFQGPTALGLAEVKAQRLLLRLYNVEELMERRIELTRSIDVAVEHEAYLGGVFALVEVVRDQTGEGVGLGLAKCLFHALSVGLKHLLQKKPLPLPLPLVVVLFLRVPLHLIMVVVVMDLMNPRPNLIVGLGLDGEPVLVGESGGGRGLRARSSLRSGRWGRMRMDIGSRSCSSW